MILYTCAIIYKEEVAKLEERNLSLDSDLETLRQATGKEEREKADILTAEKKARAQVSCNLERLIVRGLSYGIIFFYLSLFMYILCTLHP